MTNATSRFSGLVSSAAYKVPVKVATTANITLSGLQTIDAVVLAAGDRVLVKNQTDASENGIYDVNSGVWSRSKDFNGSRDAVQGTQIWINEGTANGENFFRVDTADPFVIGTDDIAFVISPGAGTQGPKGDDGDQGIQGNTGSTGSQGNTGATGATGAQGNGGAKGDDGDQGIQGNTGSQGIQGNTGSQGNVGDQGDPGLNWTGVWLIGQNYNVGDGVKSSGSSYICTGIHTSLTVNRPGTGVNFEGVWDYLALGTEDSLNLGLLAENNLADVDNPVTSRANLGVEIGVDVQAYDAGLQSISGLTTLADRMIYTTAHDIYAATPLTAFGRSLIDDADAATARATLGIAIGTNVQAYDAGLQSISGLTTLADRMIYTTGSDAYAVATLSAFARTILDDSNAAAVRTTIGAQTLDAELTAIAGLASAANKVPYFTGSGTAAMLDFLDEDDMVSNSATGVPSQQSVKAFVEANIGTLAVTVDNFVDVTDYTSGTTDELTLSITPVNKQGTAVYFSGVYQEKSTYSLVGAVITFNDPIPLATPTVEVSISSSTVIGTPADSSVTLPKLNSTVYASQVEAEAGIENTKLMTALRTKEAIDALTPPAATQVRGWIKFTGTGTIAINDSFNVSSIVDNGTGDFTVNFTTNFADTDYCWTESGNGTNSGSRCLTNVVAAVGSMRFDVRGGTGVLDADKVCISFFGAQ